MTTTPPGPPEPTVPEPAGSTEPTAKQPSMVPGLVLLVMAAVLIVVVLAKPDMPGWLRTTIAIVAVVVVVALLAYAFVVFRATTRGGSR